MRLWTMSPSEKTVPVSASAFSASLIARTTPKQKPDLSSISMCK